MVSSGASNKFKLKSRYFNFHGTPREQNLVNSLIKEAIHINGLNMLYIPRKSVNFDQIYGEDVLSAFEKTYELVFYVESSESYSGNNAFFGNMGFDIQSQSTLILSKDVFQEVVINADGSFDENGPNNGDLIYWPTTGRIFEIVDNEKYQLFYQLGKLYTYKLTVEFWDYSNEKLKTNLPEIDKKFDNDIVKKYEIKLDSVSVIPYVVGEQVYIGSSLVISDFVGTVDEYSPDTRVITISSAFGVPVVNTELSGDGSGASASIVSFVTKNFNNTLKDNDIIETEAAIVIKKDPEDDDPGFGYGY